MIRNSAQLLYDHYGIVAELDSSGRVKFYNMTRALSSALYGDTTYLEIRQLIIDVTDTKLYVKALKRGKSEKRIQENERRR